MRSLRPSESTSSGLLRSEMPSKSRGKPLDQGNRCFIVSFWLSKSNLEGFGRGSNVSSPHSNPHGGRISALWPPDFLRVHQYLIGQSMLLSEMIREYEPFITQVKVDELAKDLPDPECTGRTIKRYGIATTIISSILCILAALAHLIAKFAGFIFSASWQQTTWTWLEACGFGIAVGIFLIVCASFSKWLTSTKNRRTCEKKKAESRAELIGLAVSLDTVKA